jgi:putative SOS response-associated peptidase YedK
MCNLYSLTKGQKAIRDLAEAMVDRAGNMPSLPAIFPNGRAPVVFARDESRPLMFFAGIRREWEGDRGTKAVPDVGRHLVFSFLTTDASLDVAPIHPDATPVLLLDEGARDTWINAPWEIARELQRPPPAGALRIVAAGAKEDPA